MRDPETFWTAEKRLQLIAKAVKLLKQPTREEPLGWTIQRIDMLAIMPAYFLEYNRGGFADLLEEEACLSSSVSG